MKRWPMILMGIMIGMTGVEATQILPLTSDDLSQKADLVFAGTCLTRDVKGGAPTHVEYAFKIETPVKGILHTGEILTIRQWGGLQGAKMPSGVATPRLLGMPVYEPGRSYLLFLGAESQAGFRVPVGLGQGVFHIFKSADGSTVVQNELGNRFLFPAETAPSAGPVKPGKTVSAPARSASPLLLNDFIQIIRKTEAQP